VKNFEANGLFHNSLEVNLICIHCFNCKWQIKLIMEGTHKYLHSRPAYSWRIFEVECPKGWTTILWDVEILGGMLILLQLRTLQNLFQKKLENLPLHGVARKLLRPNREQSTSPRVSASSGKSFVRFSTVKTSTCSQGFPHPGELYSTLMSNTTFFHFMLFVFQSF
jgi:hypothetical protein